MSKLDKLKTAAEIAQIGLGIATTLLDRRDKEKSRDKRIAELEAELAKLKEGK